MKRSSIIVTNSEFEQKINILIEEQELKRSERNQILAKIKETKSRIKYREKIIPSRIETTSFINLNNSTSMEYGIGFQYLSTHSLEDNAPEYQMINDLEQELKKIDESLLGLEKEINLLKQQIEYIRNYPLHTAAKRGDATKLIELLKQGNNPNSKDMQGKTALYYACLQCHTELVPNLTDCTTLEQNELIDLKNQVKLLMEKHYGKGEFDKGSEYQLIYSYLDGNKLYDHLLCYKALINFDKDEFSKLKALIGKKTKEIDFEKITDYKNTPFDQEEINLLKRKLNELGTDVGKTLSAKLVVNKNDEISLAKSIQKIYEDYHAPLIFKFIPFATLRRILSGHWGRHNDYLEYAKNIAEGFQKFPKAKLRNSIELLSQSLHEVTETTGKKNLTINKFGSFFRRAAYLDFKIRQLKWEKPEFVPLLLSPPTQEANEQISSQQKTPWQANLPVIGQFFTNPNLSDAHELRQVTFVESPSTPSHNQNKIN